MIDDKVDDSTGIESTLGGTEEDNIQSYIVEKLAIEYMKRWQ